MVAVGVQVFPGLEFWLGFCEANIDIVYQDTQMFTSSCISLILIEDQIRILFIYW